MSFALSGYSRDARGVGIKGTPWVGEKDEFKTIT